MFYALQLSRTPYCGDCDALVAKSGAVLATLERSHIVQMTKAIREAVADRETSSGAKEQERLTTTESVFMVERDAIKRIKVGNAPGSCG